MKNDIVEKALKLSAIAHNGQMRKEGAFPYIVHPVFTALLLAKNGFPDVVIASALVHDVLEDTSVTEKELGAELGEEILSIVKSLSEKKSLSWEERKSQYIESIRAGSDEVKAVSVADKIHNARSMIEAHKKRGSDLWKMFSRGREKQLWFAETYLDMIKSSWENPLADEYETLVDELKKLS